ncbi:MAG: methyltransferase domain-containing protein [Bacteroidetes bacterium]|nr:methyltransferase domain-containing protein [Bacteroidota bacterium]
MYLLIPGRHQLITQFQFTYLRDIIQQGLTAVKDINGNVLPAKTDKPTGIIFPVTSANHSNTRRNPLPFYLRAIMIEAMSAALDIPVYIYGIDDVGTMEHFAAYTLKRIKHDSEGQLDCQPDNTVVICSTPVLLQYEKLGFSILPAELKDRTNWICHTAMPWDIVEKIAYTPNWQDDETITSLMHPTSLKAWKKYHLGDKVQLLFRDTMISSDGDLTTTRDYNVYVRQMDEIAELKYEETARYIQPGRIGDIGCAVGSWLKLVSRDARFRESDLYGIEVSRHLYELCRQRKENGEFENPFVFFAQKNAVSGLVFEKNSMNTIHCSSLTHEIESYGSRNDLLHFIQNRYDELAPGGWWINRDVVGPADKEKWVYLKIRRDDGTNDDPYAKIEERHAFSDYLRGLSTHARFLRFVQDFRKEVNYRLDYEDVLIEGEPYTRLRLRDACEFLSRKDYTDNWTSEMHETFCYWDFEEWKQHLVEAGFSIHPFSHAFTNEWIVTNRWKPVASLWTMENDQLVPLPFPDTHMILVGVKNT